MLLRDFDMVAGRITSVVCGDGTGGRSTSAGQPLSSDSTFVARSSTSECMGMNAGQNKAPAIL